MSEPHRSVCVFGGGVAALVAALRLLECGLAVDLVVPTGLLQGRVAWGEEPVGFLSPERASEAACEALFQDTLRQGAMLVDQRRLRSFCQDVPAVSALMARLGVPFARTQEGHVRLERGPGATVDRLARADGGVGNHLRRELILALFRQQNLELLRLHEHTDLVALAVNENARCHGAVIQKLSDSSVQALPVNAVILADGGCSGMLEHEATALGFGLSQALAYEQGAALANPEFTAVGAYGTGGLWIDAKFRTGLTGVYAVGDVAPSVHGAKRLLGNSLPAVVWSAWRAAETVSEDLAAERPADANVLDSTDTVLRTTAAVQAYFEWCGPENARVVYADLVTLMKTALGSIRTNESLSTGMQQLLELTERYGRIGVTDRSHRFNQEVFFTRRLGGLIELAGAALQAAALRRETRGLHVHATFRDSDDATLRRVSKVERTKQGALVRYEELDATVLRPVRELHAKIS